MGGLQPSGRQVCSAFACPCLWSREERAKRARSLSRFCSLFDLRARRRSSAPGLSAPAVGAALAVWVFAPSRAAGFLSYFSQSPAWKEPELEVRGGGFQPWSVTSSSLPLKWEKYPLHSNQMRKGKVQSILETKKPSSQAPPASLFRVVPTASSPAPLTHLHKFLKGRLCLSSSAPGTGRPILPTE